MNILTISSLYPNTEQPRHGIFIETRMKLFRKQNPDCSITVIAPLPWFPLRNIPASGKGDYRKVATKQQRDDIRVYYPRYLALPGLGMYSNPFFMFIALLNQVKTLQHQGHTFELIDAHYFYPDVIAANWLARYLKLPIVATARGSDINILPSYRWPRKLIKKALLAVTQPVAVSQALADKMHSLLSNSRQIVCLPNGVDTSVFYPDVSDKDGSRSLFHKYGFNILSVGNLVPLKGHQLVIEALVDIPEAYLTIIGEGMLHNQLVNQVAKLKLSDRVSFHPNQPQAELRHYYASADCLVLASSDEGWPNVLLEAMACGCPVVATPFASAHEIIKSADAGIIASERSALAIRQALIELLSHLPSKNNVAAYAASFSWHNSLSQLRKVFKGAIESHSTRGNTGASDAR